MHRGVLGVVLAVLVTAGVGVIAARLEPSHPPLSDRPGSAGTAQPLVDDAAGSFGPLTEHLEQIAQGWLEDLGIEVHVATVPQAAAPLLERTERWIEEHRLGDAATTGGMLVLLEPSTGRARIAVTYDLEGVLPDALLSDLATNQLVPYASTGNVAMAVQDVLLFLKDLLLVRAASGDLPLEPRFLERPAFRRVTAFLSGGGGADVVIPAYPTGGWKAPVEAGRRHLYAPSADALESFHAYLRTLEDLVGDPELELFAPGTRLQRARTPVAPFEYRRRSTLFRRSRHFYVLTEADRAVVRAELPAPGSYPVFLHRIEGLWRVDLVELWKNVFFDRDGLAYVYNRSNPYEFGLEEFYHAEANHREHAEDDAVGPLPVSGSLVEAAEALQARVAEEADAGAHLSLAELLFRNAFCWEEALLHYQTAVRLAPDDPRVGEVVADRALYLHLYEMAIPRLERLGPAGYERLAWAHAQAGRRERALRYYQLALEVDPFSLRARRAVVELRP